MSSIQFGGLISGLKTSDIIDALMAVRRQPLTALQRKETALSARKAGYAQLGSSIDTVIARIKAFTTSGAGSSRSATSSDSTVFTASAVSSAAVGQYRIAVDRLATATQARSTTALGAPMTTAVDTSKTLSAANLAAAVTQGQMTLTVDGNAVQVAVGDPAATTLTSLMASIASTLQTQLQATDAGATVAATIVGGHLQLAVSGGTATHTVSFGAVGDTSNAATALGLASQSANGVLNPTLTGTAYLDPSLSSLNFAGSISGGQVSAIVDGAIVHYTVGDPGSTTLQQVMDGLSAAIQTQLRAGGALVGADAGASVTASIAANRLQLAVSGGASAHSISFGAAGDASNALGVFGISTQKVTATLNPTIVGDQNLGVVRTSVALDAAGLTGLVSTATGQLTINGVSIAYDTTADSLTTIIGRINSSTAGVTASLDRTNDQLVLTRKETGALAIDIEDSGTLATALHLAPGTTNAQTIGRTAQISVDGRTVVSTSNSVTNAIDGVTINLLGETALGVTKTLTIGVDNAKIVSAVKDFVAGFNALGDTLDKLTASTPGKSGGTAGTAGPLSTDPTAITMFISLRDTLLHTQYGLSGSLNSLGALGIGTGAIGAAAGSTTRLQLDESKLTAALNADPNRVALLLGDAGSTLKTVLDRLTTYQDATSSKSYVQAHLAGLDTEIASIRHQEDDMEERISTYQAALEAKYTALEATLARLQSQSSAITAQIGSMSANSSTK